MVRYERPAETMPRARKMRQESTDAERKLWLMLRDRRLGGVKFRRQASVGRYIVDFICLRRKLIVEADGGQHSENLYDTARDQWLTREGYMVVRYSNFDILKNPSGILEDMLARLSTRPEYFGSTPSPGRGSRSSPQPPSPPEGRG